MSKRHLLSRTIQLVGRGSRNTCVTSIKIMEPKVNLKQDPAYVEIQKFYDANADKINIQQLFKEDADRFNKFSLRIPTPNDGEILLDYSKNRINEQAWSLLLNLAKSRNVEKARDAMFSGEKINFTEDRAVLHIALRNRQNRPILVGGKDVTPDVNAVLAHMKEFSGQVHRQADHRCYQHWYRRV
ncbi:hypothetical protein HF086_003284 [Spodoptera exigua]|uniref:Glucose-6-phosphate isomerase n=1 Tax=Spodoptera exigua TaxID=7107 RepID=A0A922SFC5_SPOEX|nr:hypothetical protein HF086_003284 [Spodoptera exigua]